MKKENYNAYEELLSDDQNLCFDYCEDYFKGNYIEFNNCIKKELELLNKHNEFTNLAKLLSNDNNFNIKFISSYGLDKFRRREFRGSILEQFTECYSHVDKFNDIRTFYDGRNSKVTRGYPEFALHEVLVNAISHRDYTKETNTFIYIFNDRLEIINDVSSSWDYSEKDLYTGACNPTNKKLANVFNKLELNENHGKGILKILNLYSDCEKKPKFEVVDNKFKVTLYNGDFKSTL